MPAAGISLVLRLPSTDGAGFFIERRRTQDAHVGFLAH
jgi:hypothetical protein